MEISRDRGAKYLVVESGYLSCLGAEKWLKIGGGGRRWCQVSDGVLGALGLIEEMKSPCGGRGFER